MAVESFRGEGRRVGKVAKRRNRGRIAYFGVELRRNRTDADLRGSRLSFILFAIQKKSPSLQNPAHILFFQQSPEQNKDSPVGSSSHEGNVITKMLMANLGTPNSNRK